MSQLIHPSPIGPYCEAGGFAIDPWGAAERALVTHAHSDHARWGSRTYLCSDSCAPLLRERLGAGVTIESLPFGHTVRLGDTTVSFHPAGHILGSAQVRVECRGEVWVFSGDYKLTPDATCEPFEPVRCDVFITESTFGLPIYRWPNPDRVMRDITEWWRGNAAAGRTSVLYAYPLGKTQRILGGLAEFGELPGPLAVHGGGARMTELYRAAGRRLADAHPATSEAVKSLRGSGLLICSPIAEGTGPLRRLGETSTAFASGWMRIRGVRRRRALDRGFCISDHADWPGLLTAIRECGASRIAVTHGYTAQLVRHLREKGVDAWEFPTRYSGEPSELDASAATSDAREASRAKRPHQPDSDAPPPPGAPQGELPL